MDAILVTIYVTRSTSNVGCYFSDYMSLDQSLMYGCYFSDYMLLDQSLMYGCYFSDYMSLDQSLNVGKCELLLFLGAYELLIFRCL